MGLIFILSLLVEIEELWISLRVETEKMGGKRRIVIFVWYSKLVFNMKLTSFFEFWKYVIL